MVTQPTGLSQGKWFVCFVWLGVALMGLPLEASINEQIAQLDIESATLADVLAVFGEPESYRWVKRQFTREELPTRNYCVEYDNGFSIWMQRDRVMEFRFEQGCGYVWNESLTLGMPMDEAVAIVGEPKEEMQGGKNTFIDRILYRDIEGKEGHAYYARSDLNLRLWFSDNRLKHIYVTRSDFGHGKEDRLLTKEELPDGSLINAEGHIEDKIDYPFVDDPRVRGYWVSIDFIGDLNDFNPQVKADPDLYFKEMHLLPEGKSNWAFRWTKGLILHDGDKTASRYFLREVDGEKYLIFEWKSGDYTIRHWKPGYYVMKQGPEVPYVESRVTDRTDYPFVDDPAVVGTWKSVDFVATPDEFNPNERQWQGGELYLKELVLLPGGKTPKSWQTWTKGLIIHHGDKTASRYLLKTIDGATYLFFEWKSGDYTIRRMKPKYYVLTKP